MSIGFDLAAVKADLAAKGVLRAPVGTQSVLVGPLAEHLVPTVEALTPARIAILADDTQILGADGPLKAWVRDQLAPLAPLTPVDLGVHVHADEVTVEAAVAGCAGADVVVTVGSGTACDIGKVAAKAAGARHVVVQTAASVNGYVDDQSVLLKAGVKRTSPSDWPHAVLIDPEVLRRAPAELNRSGLGDMISMFTAPADWYLANALDMGDGWSGTIGTLARVHGDDLLAAAPGIGSGDPEALATLGEILSLSGVSMGAAGQTAVSSGMEHTVAHLLDMAAGAQHRPNAWHGAQVGVATILVAAVWDRIRARLDAGTLPAVTLPDEADAERQVRAAFDRLDPTGAMSNECWSDYAKKLDRARRVDLPAQVAAFQADWARHAAVLGEILVPFEQVVAALRAAGAPVRFADLSAPVDPKDVLWALADCHLMRNRFTIADLAFLTGCWEQQDVWDVVDAVARLGAGMDGVVAGPEGVVAGPE